MKFQQQQRIAQSEETDRIISGVLNSAQNVLRQETETNINDENEITRKRQANETAITYENDRKVTKAMINTAKDKSNNQNSNELLDFNDFYFSEANNNYNAVNIPFMITKAM